jgi:hypothetical protein
MQTNLLWVLLTMISVVPGCTPWGDTRPVQTEFTAVDEDLMLIVDRIVDAGGDWPSQAEVNAIAMAEGDTVRIISRQRTGTIDRISDGIAIIRPDDNISHFTAAFITDLEPKP